MGDFLRDHTHKASDPETAAITPGFRWPAPFELRLLFRIVAEVILRHVNSFGGTKRTAVSFAAEKS